MCYRNVLFTRLKQWHGVVAWWTLQYRTVRWQKASNCRGKTFIPETKIQYQTKMERLIEEHGGCGRKWARKNTEMRLQRSYTEPMQQMDNTWIHKLKIWKIRTATKTSDFYEITKNQHKRFQHISPKLEISCGVSRNPLGLLRLISK